MRTVRCSSRLLGSVSAGGEGARPWGPGGGGFCPGGVCLPDTPPPVDRMTDACENLTLPQLRCGR